MNANVYHEFINLYFISKFFHTHTHRIAAYHIYFLRTFDRATLAHTADKFTRVERYK